MLTAQPSKTLVYSAESGRICLDYCQSVAHYQYAVNWRALAAACSASADGVLRMQRETAGRDGKSEALVHGLALDALAAASGGVK